MPDKVFDTNKGDSLGRAELFCLLLSEVGFKPYLLQHGAGRGVDYVATIDVTADELKTISAEVGKQLKPQSIGKLNLLPISLYKGGSIGDMPAGTLDEKGRFVSRVEVRKMRPFGLPKNAPEANIVAGHVLEQDNRPVKGLHVRLVYVNLKYPTKFFEDRKKYDKKVVTDETGAFRFTGLVDGLYNMDVLDPKTGFPLHEARFIRAGTNVVNLVLAPIKTVQIKVVNEDEKAVAGVGVGIYLSWHGWRGNKSRNRVMTGADGVAKLTFRSAYPYSMVLTHSSYADTYYSFDGYDAEITQTIQRGMTVRGKLLAPPSGAKGLKIEAQVESNEVDLTLQHYARMDAQGRFLFTKLPPGKATIRVRLGYSTICSHVVDPDSKDEVVFDLSKTTTVVGTVCIKGNSKLCSSLLFTDEGGVNRFARVEKDGAFSIPFLAPGTYTVKSYDRRIRSKEMEVKVEAGKKLDLMLTTP